MTIWTLNDSRKSITLSKKNNDLTVDVGDGSCVAVEGDKSGNNLILTFYIDKLNNGVITSKTLTIKNYVSYMNDVELIYNHGEYSFDGLLKEYFATDGLVFAGDFLTKKAQSVKGSKLSEILIGGTGKDKLYSNGGRDIFMAGNGNDTIYAGKDKNVYVLNGNFGTDTIYLDKTDFNIITFYDPTTEDDDFISKNIFDGLISVTKDNFKSFTRQGNDLVVTIDHEKANGTLVLKNYFNLYGTIQKDPVSFLLADSENGWNDFKTYLTENGYNAENTTAEDFIKILKNATLNSTTPTSKDISETVLELEYLIPSDRIEELLTLGYKNEAEAAANKKAIKVTDSLLDETIYGGQGSDKITIVGGEDKVYAGNGNNTIKVLDDVIGTYIETGSGNNKITIGEETNNIEIYTGDGNNSISIGEESGKFDITTKDYGDAFGIYVETGKGKDTIKLDEECNGVYIDAGAGNNTIKVGKESGSFNQKIVDDEISSYQGLAIKTGTGKDSISIGNSCKGAYIFADNGNNTVKIGKYSGGFDSEAINSGADALGTYGLCIGTGKDKDNISIGDYCKGAYIDSGVVENNTIVDTADTIKIGNYADHVQIDAGDGKNNISIGKYSGSFNEKANSTEGKLGLIIETGKDADKITIGDGCKGAMVDAGAGNNTIKIGKNSGGYKQVEEDYYTQGLGIFSDKGNDKITIGDYCKGAYIDSGKGNDTISIGKYSDHILITAVGGAKNSVTVGKNSGGFDEEAAKIEDIDESQVFGLIIETGNVSSDKITIGDNCKGALINSAEYQGTNDDSVDSSNYGYDTVTIGQKAEDIYLSTGHGNDKITIGAYAKDVYIEAKDGNDKITIGNKSENVYIEAGEGNDTIKTGAKNNYFWFDCDYSLGKDTITVSKGSVNTLEFSTYNNPDRLFYKYDKNDLIIGFECFDEGDVSLVTLKNLNTKSYKDTQVNILVDGEAYKIDSILYDFSNTKKGQTIKTSDNYEYKQVVGSFGSDKIYISGGETEVLTTDGKADTIYANKTDGFDINEDHLYIAGDSKDKLIISGQGANDLKVFFDVELTPDGHTTGYEVSIYSSNDATGGISFNYFNNTTSSNLGSIENNGEKLNTSLFDQIASEVANWLGGTEFTSADQALYQGTEEQIAQLTAIYAQDNLWV